MNKKGFTLVELLAVIVILAVIALIATPQILGMIESSRKGAAEASALGYVEAVEKQLVISQLKDDQAITGGVYTKRELDSKGVKVKGEINDGNIVIGTNGRVIKANFYINGYSVEYDGEKAEATDKNGLKEIKTGATLEKAKTGETHKGIVYLDPTNLKRYCNASNSISRTEVKTGCMKWYIYNDSGSDYKLILDHNTTARIKWNDSNSNVAYTSSNLYSVVQDLKTTSKWVVDPDIIEASEVSSIVGGVSAWNSSNDGTWFYFEGTGTNKQTLPTYNTTNRSKYDWLYNNLNKCKTDTTDFGCTIEDGNTYSGYGTAGAGQTWAYWTKTPVGTAGSGSLVWNVIRHGDLRSSSAYSISVGVRPVIKVSKSIFQ